MRRRMSSRGKCSCPPRIRPAGNHVRRHRSSHRPPGSLRNSRRSPARPHSCIGTVSSDRMMLRWARRSSGFALVCIPLACQAILGIEDTSTATQDADAASGGSLSGGSGGRTRDGQRRITSAGDGEFPEAGCNGSYREARRSRASPSASSSLPAPITASERVACPEQLPRW